MSLAPAAHLHARVSIEASITLRCRQYAGASVGPEHFGASADYRK
jgi:transketolase